MYSQWVRPGDLVFDIGAHLGDRTIAFAGLGARVVALEPQPVLFRWLSRIAGGRDSVELLELAAGESPQTATLAISRATPSVSTLSGSWRRKISRDNPGFRSVNWDETVEVAVTTLDELIDQFGQPVFCKIDVEGYEDRVLAGLSRPLDTVSVEFVAGALDVAISAVDRLVQLGDYRFNAIPGEKRTLLWSQWREADEIRNWFADGADGLNSGDLYARLGRRKPNGAPQAP